MLSGQAEAAGSGWIVVGGKGAGPEIAFEELQDTSRLEELLRCAVQEAEVLLQEVEAWWKEVHCAIAETLSAPPATALPASPAEISPSKRTDEASSAAGESTACMSTMR